MNEIINYFTTLPLLELTAVVVSILYVVLAAKENIWCWPAALVSTFIYSVIFYDVYLWMDSLLQIYYLLMAIFGWYCWYYRDDNGVVLAIQSWPVSFHSKAIVILSVISALLGWFMATYTPASWPFLDAFTTVFAVFATYLLTIKVLENWLYFVVIDFVSIYIYIEKGLKPTAFLFALYVVLASVGYFTWRRHVDAASQSASSR